MAEATRLSRGLGLSIAKDFEDNNDAEVLVCSRNRQRGLEAGKEISRKVVGAELGVTSISKAKQPLGEIIDYRRRITIAVKKTCGHFGFNTWHKIDHELESIGEVGLNGSTRNRRNRIDTLTCCYSFFGG